MQVLHNYVALLLSVVGNKRFSQITHVQDILTQVLQILLKSKLLVSPDDENDLQPVSKLSLFFGYKK